jgi:hypothetical protein
VDGCNNVLVTGVVQNTGKRQDYIMAKYDGPKGVLRWSHTHNKGSVNGDDAPKAMVVFPDGQAHSAGSPVGTYYDDCLTLLYNPRFRALTVPANQIIDDLISGDVNSLFSEDTNNLKIASGEGSECGFVATTVACPTDFTSGKIRVKAKSTLTGTRLKIDVYNYTCRHPDP